MDKQRTEELLKGVSQEDLISIIWKMTACSREAENVLISWGRKNEFSVTVMLQERRQV